MLLDLPGEVRLSWHAEDDPEAGIPVEVERWAWTAEAVELQFGVTAHLPHRTGVPPRYVRR